jgi:hypothetical protein
MRTETKHYHDLDTPNGGLSLELPFPMSSIMDYKALLVQITDIGVTIGYLADDEDVANPCEDDAYMGHIYTCRRFSPTLRDYEKARALGDFDGETPDPFAVSLDVYEHGLVRYSVAGEGMQCRFDTARGGAVWVPSDELREELRELASINKELVWPRMKELAKQACETYTDWCNGDCYMAVVASYDLEGDPTDSDTCGHLIGGDSAYECLKSDYFPSEAS